MNPQTDTGRERQWVQFRQTSIGPSDRHLKKRNVGHQSRKTPIETPDRHWQKKTVGSVQTDINWPLRQTFEERKRWASILEETNRNTR